MASMYSEVAALGLSYSDSTSERINSNFEQIESRRDLGNSMYMDCSCTMEDVIVLAEFSEVKGPIPLITVPIDISHFGVDLDDFILKIMAVDYQASASGSFRFSMDTEVLQTDVIEDVHAYVHYYTLNDIYARGFVRPLCLAYISRNKRRLELNLSQLRESFLQVSDAMKEENRYLFLEEVSLGMQKLKDIQYRYFQWKQKLEDEDVERGDEANSFISLVNLDQLVEQQTEYNKILQSGRSILENTHLFKSLIPWKDSFSSSDILEIEHYMTYVKLMVGHHGPLSSNQKSGDATSELRPIAALSPFGVAISIWLLCQIQSQFNNCDLELRGGCFWGLGGGNSDAGDIIGTRRSHEYTKREVQQALECEMYRKLLLQLLPASLAIPYGDNLEHVSDASESEVSIKVASWNDASSSYYSALDSMNDSLGPNSIKMRNPTKQSEKPRNFPAEADVSSTGNHSVSMQLAKNTECNSSDDEYSSDGLEYQDLQVSESFTFPVDELWCRCIWTGWTESNLAYPGLKILHFFKTFSKVAQHILYSLLTGRTVVIAGSNSLRPKVWQIISALIYLVPTEEESKYLRWHRGILVSAHIEKYKIIGLCVPERLTVHDMISPRDKNSVTILDVSSKKILGPAYSGVLLADVHENFDQNFLCAEALVLYLQSVFAGIHQKVFLFKALSLNQPKMKALLAKDIMLALRIKGRDIDIVNYMKKFISL